MIIAFGIAVGVCMASVGLVLVYVAKRRMTVCLTFDDGLKTHYTIVAQQLEAKGWVGCFSVPTAFVSPEERSLTPEEYAELCVNRSNDVFVSWAEVIDLEKRGHLVVPHTAHHKNLRELQFAGRDVDLQVEVGGALSKFEREVGLKPRFFCFPHNASSSKAIAMLKDHGVKPFLCPREDFGGGVGFLSEMKIRDWILGNVRRGAWHVDIMVHGVDRDLGGWRPFDDAEAFELFLSDIKDLEKDRLIRVVPFAAAHARDCSHSGFVRKAQRAVCKLRRMLVGRCGGVEI